MHLCHYFTADQIQDALVELDTLRDSRDLSLCTLMAIVYAEKRKTNPGIQQSSFVSFFLFLFLFLPQMFAQTLLQEQTGIHHILLMCYKNKAGLNWRMRFGNTQPRTSKE